jgi:hypothetical protein
MSHSSAQTKNNQRSSLSPRTENEIYLRRHPEIQAIVSYFIKETLLRQPKDIESFAVEVLSHPELQSQVQQQQQNHNTTPTTALSQQE